jgi:hypothetical protein
VPQFHVYYSPMLSNHVSSILDGLWLGVHASPTDRALARTPCSA